MSKLRNIVLFAAVLLLAVACRKTNVSVDPSSVVIPTEGGTVDVAVSSNGDWTVEGCPDWITLSTSMGTGNATLSLTAPRNVLGADRDVRISLVTEHKSAVLEVSQKTFAEQFLTVSPVFFDARIGGDTLTLNVVASAPWTVSCPEPWISLEPQAGEGDGQVKVTVASGVSDDFDLRRAYVTLTCSGLSREVKIYQCHSEKIATYPSVLDFGYEAGVDTLFLHAPGQWKSTNCPDWISVSPEEGEGSCFVAVHVTENPLYEDRSDNPIFRMGADKAVLKVNQAGLNSLNYINVNPKSIFFSYEGGSRQVEVSCNRDWNVTTDCDWLTISPLSGNGDGTLLVETEANPYVNSDRSGTVTLTSHDKTVDIVVGQNSGTIVPMLSIDVPNHTLQFDDAAGTKTVNITANVAWTITCDADWLSVTPASGNGNASLSVTVQANDSFIARNAIVFIQSIIGTVRLYVVQSGHEAIIQLGMDELHVPLIGGQYTVNVTANQLWKVTSSEWISCSPPEGSGNGSIVITVTPCTLTNERIGQVTVSGVYGGSATVRVVQSSVY